ncbi:hypothetical protein V070_01904 [Staphylococcus aureus C0673]|uniref:DUF6036 family nucleotidyltransferase n=1 Tax=Mammaliicoccus sp. N-M50 TaxID=2898709 RepID=UPI0004478B64|nr:DUF6036 family nucleotidyltransferase [Mammaliicoccus sp. N-M50]EZX20449.1 hypothetical protein V070_01904 [Staphylococcus aureus C0673]
MSYTLEQAQKDLKNISKSEILYYRMIKVASIITRLIDSKTTNIYNKPIVVGGLSVEIYTDSDYTTRDIDFVTSASKELNCILEELGFIKDSRMYLYKPLEIYVDVVSSSLEPLEGYKQINTLQIDEDNYIYVISPEDIIIDRTLDYAYADNEKYINYILINRYDEIDKEYIRKILKREDPETLEIFDEWNKRARDYLNKDKESHN